MDNLLKKIGLYFFIYIITSLIFIQLNLYKQLLTLTLLLLFYIYYNYYYSNLNELFNYIKNEGNNLISPGNDLKYDLKYNTENKIDNKKIDNNEEVIKDTINQKLNKINYKYIPSLGNLENVYDITNNFANNYIPIISNPSLQIKQDNNIENFKIKIDKLIKEYNNVIYNMLNKRVEELNYFQQLKNIKKEICLLFHNIIFINHLAEPEINNVIQKIKNIFKKIEDEVIEYFDKKPHKWQNEYLDNNKFNAANTYEENILF